MSHSGLAKAHYFQSRRLPKIAVLAFLILCATDPMNVLAQNSAVPVNSGTPSVNKPLDSQMPPSAPAASNEVARPAFFDEVIEASSRSMKVTETMVTATLTTVIVVCSLAALVVGVIAWRLKVGIARTENAATASEE